MKIKFYYMLPCDLSLFTCFLTSKEHKDNSYLLGKRPNRTSSDKKDQRVVRINSYTFYIFLNELQCSRVFHRAVALEIKKSAGPFVIQLMPNKLEFIDKTW